MILLAGKFRLIVAHLLKEHRKDTNMHIILRLHQFICSDSIACACAGLTSGTPEDDQKLQICPVGCGTVII